MPNTYSELGVAPYVDIFHNSKKGIEEITLPNKAGKAKAGTYQFIELYCVMINCDCRKVVLQVINEKQRPVALIDFPLNIDQFLNFPDLTEDVKQSAAAEDILGIFTEHVADSPDWYRGMCQRYRAVRKRIDGKPYNGKRFPSKKNLEFLFDDSEIEMDEIREMLDDFLAEEIESYDTQLTDSSQGSLIAGENEIEALIETYRHHVPGDLTLSATMEKRLRAALRQDRSADDLAIQLVTLYRAEDDQGIDATLLLLTQVMDILRTNLERRRPKAEEIMNLWQTALAHHVFCPEIDLELGAEVTGVLLNARVEILPQLHQASAHRMAEITSTDEQFQGSSESMLEDLLEDFDKMGASSAFEFVDVLLQMMAIGDAEVQLELYRRMFYSNSTIARETAALMLFHPQLEMRAQVADFLAHAEGEFFTSIILRRLIISRNWFPEKMRKMLDQAITNARRARIDCAPLKSPVKVRAYASTVDGAEAQSLQIIIPQGRQYLGCSIMPKKGFGVADAFLLTLESKGHLQQFRDMLQSEIGGVEVSIEYIDQRLCQVLADGARVDKVPNHWLLAIAEQLGWDQWKAVSFDGLRELELLKSELENKRPATLSTKKRQQALLASSTWPERLLFADSWFEDDIEVDAILDHFFRQHKYSDRNEPIELLVDKILELRRAAWLERLILTTTWLKSAKKAPLPWEQMYHVASAVADDNLPLKQIPLMRTIAERSIGAFFGRLDDSADT
ncbi:MAG: hypothetical protein PF441_12030 [Desulfuromusa sp.]|jgi:hypothetical protein|nr:hypothetical protein [Desulfuromusa sp.]